MALRDTVSENRLEECGSCNGAGQYCPTCDEHPDNCECTETGEQWLDCPECNGEGVVECEPDEDEESDDEDEDY